MQPKKGGYLLCPCQSTCCIFRLREGRGIQHIPLSLSSSRWPSGPPVCSLKDCRACAEWLSPPSAQVGSAFGGWGLGFMRKVCGPPQHERWTAFVVQTLRRTAEREGSASGLGFCPGCVCLAAAQKRHLRTNAALQLLP